jgi:hypothetical protein
VPRRSRRANGWDPEVQRAFIAALSLTGSRRAACRAVGRSDFGVNQLLANPGSEGFRAAYDEAMAIAADERSRRLAEGLRTVAAEQAGWRPPDPPWARARAERDRTAATRRGRPDPVEQPAPPEPEAGDIFEQPWFEDLMIKYFFKVEAERNARIEGRVVEADFYLRQMTWLEVTIDLVGGDGMRALRDFRAEDRHLVEIAETPFSSLLADARRLQWAAMDDPPRPEHPPARYLQHQGRFSTEPLETYKGGPLASQEQQRQTYRERHRQEAEAQLRWEAEARRDFERRRSTEGKADDA